MSWNFRVRVGMGNGSVVQAVNVEASNASFARRMAEAQTGGKALAVTQVPKDKPKK